MTNEDDKIYDNEIYNENDNDDQIEKKNSKKAMRKIGAYMNKLSKGLLEIVDKIPEENRDEKIKEFRENYEAFVNEIPDMEKKIVSEKFKDVIFKNYEMEDAPEIGGKLST